MAKSRMLQAYVRDPGLFRDHSGAICNTSWKRRMTTLLSRIAMRVAYGASQLPRFAWYVGHGLAMRRLARAARRRDGEVARQR
jgi:hypothetical protein